MAAREPSIDSTGGRASIATFFASVTPVMHDFWNSDDPDERQQELLHFPKNSALLGAGLVVVTYGRRRG